MSFKLKHSIRLWLVLGSLSLGANAQAMTVNSLEQALVQVSQYQQSEHIWQQRQQMSELAVKQSRLWQNPSINLSRDGFGSSQDQELSLGISQPIDIFGQRRIQKNIARLAGQQNELQEKLWEAQSQLIVKYAWSQFLISQSEAQIQKSQLQVSRETLDSAKKRYQAGSIALVEYERAQIEAAENERNYQQAILNKEIAKRNLSNLWGETEAEVKVDSNRIYWPDQVEQNVQNYISAGYLEKLYALNVVQANQRIEQLKIRAKPNPNLNVGMTRTKAPNETNDTSLSVGVDIPFNIFNRQQYQIPLAQRQQSLLERQQQRELKQQILEIANSFHQVRGLKLQYDAVLRQKDLSEKVQMRSLLGFKNGKLSITEVQQATTQLQNIRLSQIQLLREAWQTALAAEALSIGISYEQISRSDAYTQLLKEAVSQSENFINIGAE
ncbi:TolC family protein [Acinetobacter sp. DSM 11652]|uniref:TolC family protein n=1 Tax=Acinetobacter sp. DSM 11652 TaxID=346222 RepID=UPI0008CABDD3|nr:TolC family protein [Acinetobacter sp. DSM 11652]SEL46703.1 Outer membrane protein TolC [Acinetobacter sp. DSM 11652]